MATFGRVEARTMQAVSDLRLLQYHVLRATGAGTTNIASNPGGGPNEVIGVLQNKPNSGQAAAVGFFGETKVVGGGTVTANALQAPNGSGRVIDATSGQFVIGMALETAATDGEIVRMLLRMPAVELTNSQAI